MGWDGWWGEQSAEDSEHLLALLKGSDRWRSALRFLERTVGLQGAKVVELGSGTGLAGLLLAEAGAEVTLVDSSDNALAMASRIWARHGLAHRALKEDLLNLDGCLADSFDVSLSFGTIEHFTERERVGAFTAHSLVLREGGASVVSVPNLYYPLYFFSRPVARLRRRNESLPPVEVRFTKGELLRMGKSVGFGVAEVEGGGLSNDLMFLGRKSQVSSTSNPQGS